MLRFMQSINESARFYVGPIRTCENAFIITENSGYRLHIRFLNTICCFCFCFRIVRNLLLAIECEFRLCFTFANDPITANKSIDTHKKQTNSEILILHSVLFKAQNIFISSSYIYYLK